MKLYDKWQTKWLQRKLLKIIKNPYFHIESKSRQLWELYQKWESPLIQEIKESDLPKLLENPKWQSYVKRLNQELDPEIFSKILFTVGYQAVVKGNKQRQKLQEKYHLSIPYVLSLDFVRQCAGNCSNCRSKHLLSFAEWDQLIDQGEQVGIHFYMLIGNDPLLHKKELLTLLKKHSTSFFLIITDGLLLQDHFLAKVKKLGNVSFSLTLQVEDEKIQKQFDKMRKLKENGCFFGASIVYTNQNIEQVTSDRFLEMCLKNGCYYIDYIHYKPQVSMDKNLLPTPDQRCYMKNKIQQIRDSSIPLLVFDFQNDKKDQKGCGAARNYLHINRYGDVQPCFFIPYSDANIHNSSLLTLLKQPFYQMFQRMEPFHENPLRACPLLENPEKLRKIIYDTQTVPTSEVTEEMEDIFCQCDEYADAWREMATKLWNEPQKK